MHTSTQSNEWFITDTPGRLQKNQCSASISCDSKFMDPFLPSILGIVDYCQVAHPHHLPIPKSPSAAGTTNAFVPTCFPRPTLGN